MRDINQEDTVTLSSMQLVTAVSTLTLDFVGYNVSSTAVL